MKNYNCDAEMFFYKTIDDIIDRVCTFIIRIDASKYSKLKQFSQAIHKLSLVFHKGMNITFECDRGILVSEDFGQRFHVHTALNSSCSKGVSECMKSMMGNLLFLKEQFKAALIGTNRNNLIAVPYYVL